MKAMISLFFIGATTLLLSGPGMTAIDKVCSDGCDVQWEICARPCTTPSCVRACDDAHDNCQKSCKK